MATARLKASVVLPRPPLGEWTTKVRDVASGVERQVLLLDRLDGGHEVVAAEGHRQDAHDAHLGRHLDRPLGHRDEDDRQVDAGRPDPLQQLQAAQLALEQGVDHEHVRPHLGDLIERLTAIGQHIQQLHLILSVQQIPDVLRDLGDVLDEEQANMRRRAGHRATIQKR